IRPRISLGVAKSAMSDFLAAPILLCLQNAVGPLGSATRSTAQDTMASAPTLGHARDRSARTALASAATLRTARIPVARRHTQGAVSDGSRPKPPASEPRMAPAVFHA